MKTSMKIWTLAAVMAAVAGLAAAGSEVPGGSVREGICPALAGQLDEYIKETMVREQSPGIIVGVVQGETLTYAGYFGWADIEAGREVDETTIFRIGSISKSFTAIGLLQQWEEGKFNLDDDINKYLPESLVFPPHPDTNPVTFRHLLTHTSGGGEILSYKQAFLPGQGIQVDGMNYDPLYEYLKLGMKTRIEPGANYAYCNYGYGFLGLALEHISGQPFNEYMIEHVFKPLGMEKATFEHDAEMLKDIAVGYRVAGGEFKAAKMRSGGITSAGNIFCTLKEFAEYGKALVNGGANRHGRVIKEETLKMMMTTQYTLDERQEGYGFAFRTHGDNPWGHRIVGHSGSVPFGYTAQMLVAPDEKVAVLVAANTGTRAPTEIGWGVLKRVLGAKAEVLPTDIRSPETWPELVGVYGPQYHHAKVNARLAMNSIGNYEIKVIEGELNLIYTWRGARKAMKLHQLDASDPYFYWIENTKPTEAPFKRLAFKQKDGKIFIIPGGLNEYVKLTPLEKAKADFWLPAGRMIGAVNPF